MHNIATGRIEPNSDLCNELIIFSFYVENPGIIYNMKMKLDGRKRSSTQVVQARRIKTIPYYIEHYSKISSGLFSLTFNSTTSPIYSRNSLKAGLSSRLPKTSSSFAWFAFW